MAIANNAFRLIIFLLIKKLTKDLKTFLTLVKYLYWCSGIICVSVELRYFSYGGLSHLLLVFR